MDLNSGSDRFLLLFIDNGIEFDRARRIPFMLPTNFFNSFGGDEGIFYARDEHSSARRHLVLSFAVCILLFVFCVLLFVVLFLQKLGQFGVPLKEPVKRAR